MYRMEKFGKNLRSFVMKKTEKIIFPIFDLINVGPTFIPESRVVEVVVRYAPWPIDTNLPKLPVQIQPQL